MFKSLKAREKKRQVQVSFKYLVRENCVKRGIKIISRNVLRKDFVSLCEESWLHPDAESYQDRFYTFKGTCHIQRLLLKGYTDCSGENKLEI